MINSKSEILRVGSVRLQPLRIVPNPKHLSKRDYNLEELNSIQHTPIKKKKDKLSFAVSPRKLSPSVRLVQSDKILIRSLGMILDSAMGNQRIRRPQHHLLDTVSFGVQAKSSEKDKIPPILKSVSLVPASVKWKKSIDTIFEDSTKHKAQTMEKGRGREITTSLTEKSHSENPTRILDLTSEIRICDLPTIGSPTLINSPTNSRRNRISHRDLLVREDNIAPRMPHLSNKLSPSVSTTFSKFEFSSPVRFKNIFRGYGAAGTALLNNQTAYHSLIDNAIVSSPLSIIPMKKNLMPKVTARCWALFDGQTRTLVAGKNDQEIREIASLTKIMTCLACLRLAENLNINPHTYMINISAFAATMLGTSAELKAGDTLTLWDLLHGLMLPSGNDAAFAISEHFGNTLFFLSDEYRDLLKAKETKKATDVGQIRCNNPVSFFISEMNRYAKDLALNNTIFANSHGLSHKNNRSSARDLGLLCCEAMGCESFRKIVSSKEYHLNIANNLSGIKRIRAVSWENTNKLLWREFDGLKTGNTPAAGPCLASALKKNGELVICVVLCCRSQEQRFNDSEKLAFYGLQRLLNGEKELLERTQTALTDDKSK